MIATWRGSCPQPLRHGGTLVDANYHHAIAWLRASREHDITLPIWQIHRHIGMGGDQFVPALTDAATDEHIGETPAPTTTRSTPG